MRSWTSPTWRRLKGYSAKKFCEPLHACSSDTRPRTADFLSADQSVVIKRTRNPCRETSSGVKISPIRIVERITYVATSRSMLSSGRYLSSSPSAARAAIVRAKTSTIDALPDGLLVSRIGGAIECQVRNYSVSAYESREIGA